MMQLRPQEIEIGEVGTVALGGWLFGCLVFGVIFILVELLNVGIGMEGLLLLPQLFFMILFGVGLLSVVWVLPTALLLVALLRFLNVGRLVGAGVCVLVGCGYALGLSRLPDDWQWWSDFWYAAPIYGAALGWIYARTLNA